MRFILFTWLPPGGGSPALWLGGGWHSGQSAGSRRRHSQRSSLLCRGAVCAAGVRLGGPAPGGSAGCCGEAGARACTGGADGDAPVQRCGADQFGPSLAVLITFGLNLLHYLVMLLGVGWYFLLINGAPHAIQSRALSMDERDSELLSDRVVEPRPPRQICCRVHCTVCCNRVASMQGTYSECCGCCE